MEYKEFVSDIFNKLSPSQKHEIFYYSLFDPSSWEEWEREDRERYPKFQEEVDKKVVDMVKGVTPRFYRKHAKSERRRMKFLRTFVYGGDLCCFLLAAALNEKKITTRISKSGFPDLVVATKGEEKVGVEVKRLLSCANIREHICDEIVEPLKGGVWKKNIKLLFLFPQFGKENPSRIQQIIKGFYVLEDYMSEKAGVETKLLSKYVEKEHHEDSRYSFSGLIDDLSKWVI